MFYNRFYPIKKKNKYIYIRPELPTVRFGALLSFLMSIYMVRSSKQRIIA